MICSICGLVTCGISSIVGLILSIIGLNKSKKLNGNGKSQSIVGIVVGAVIILLWMIMMAAGVGSSNKSNSTINKTTNKDTDNAQTETTKPKESEYALNKMFEFDDLEITISSEVSYTQISNEYSENNGQTVVKMPITVKNLSGDTHSLNMFFYKVYGSQGTEVDSMSAYFMDDSVDFAGDLRSGASYTKYLYFIYDGNGTYTIKFDNYSEEIEINFDINK